MKKNTVAFLTRSLVDATGISMWRGIVDTCKKEKNPVITFRGPVLNKGNGSIIYNLINDDTFSGLLSWASSDVTKDVEDYYLQYEKTTLVCITFKVKDKPVVYADCKNGMIELMNHLIEHHNYKKIAFIRGPKTHIYAKERYEGYIESLKTHQIEIDERLISDYGTWGIEAGEEAVKKFIQNGLVPGKDIEAIVCVGDNVAIGTQEYIIKQGYQVPHDIAICGFNGTNDAACCNPPITTVEMPFHGIGEKSCQILFDKMKGNEFNQETRYSTSLLLGESCGCNSLSITNSILQPKDYSKESSFFSLFKREKKSEKIATIEYYLLDDESQKELKKAFLKYLEENNINKTIYNFFEERIPILIKLFATAITSKKIEHSDFIADFSKTLNKFIEISNDFSLWQDFLSILNKFTNEIISGTIFAEYSGNLLQQARIKINEFDSRYQKQKSLFALRYEADLRTTSANLLSSYDIPTLMDILQKSLKKLNIPGVYVALYENCNYTPENKDIPKKSRLVLAIRDNERLNLGKDGVVFDTEKIIPDQYLPQSNFYSLILESLHFQDTFIGYIVFQEGPKEGSSYVALRDQLSSSIYGALLLKKLNENKQNIENTMISMADKADIVSDKSKNISNNMNTISQSMDIVASSVRNISEDIHTVTKTVNDASEMMNEVNQKIGNLVESTDQITQAVALINDIAETTNVLALNASIEASHAGEAGQGFSVVAKEVKVLASKTVESTEKILELVTKNTKNTKAVQKVISSTNSSIQMISNLSEDIKDSISEQVNSTSTISTQLSSTSSNAEQITKAIDEIAKLGTIFKK